MAHIPRIIGGTYIKEERDDNFIFRKKGTISIRAVELDRPRVTDVKLNIPYRGLVLTASKEKIKSHGDVLTFYGEVKYHLPLKDWTVLKGDKEWYKKI